MDGGLCKGNWYLYIRLERFRLFYWDKNPLMLNESIALNSKLQQYGWDHFRKLGINLKL